VKMERTNKQRWKWKSGKAGGNFIIYQKNSKKIWKKELFMTSIYSKRPQSARKDKSSRIYSIVSLGKKI